MMSRLVRLNGVIPLVKFYYRFSYEEGNKKEKRERGCTKERTLSAYEKSA